MTQPSEHTGLSVLVVSAEPSIRRTRVLLLEEAGHDAQVAESNAQAKEILQLFNFHAVMLDHTLSREDRVNLIQFIRQTAPNTRILLLHKSGTDCGADLHLDSREGPIALLSAIGSLLKQSLTGTL